VFNIRKHNVKRQFFTALYQLKRLSQQYASFHCLCCLTNEQNS